MAHTTWRWSSHRLLDGGWSQVAVISTHFGGSRGVGNICPLTSGCRLLLLCLLLCMLRLFLVWLRAGSGRGIGSCSTATALVLLLSKASLESLEHIVTGLLLYMCVFLCIFMNVRLCVWVGVQLQWMYTHVCICVLVCVCVCERERERERVWCVYVFVRNDQIPTYRYTVFLHEVFRSVMALSSLTRPVASLRAWCRNTKSKSDCLAIIQYSRATVICIF